MWSTKVGAFNVPLRQTDRQTLRASVRTCMRVCVRVCVCVCVCKRMIVNWHSVAVVIHVIFLRKKYKNFDYFFLSLKEMRSCLMKQKVQIRLTSWR